MSKFDHIQVHYDGDEKQIPITLSKKGLPCLYEAGGAFTHTGSSQLIADQFGARKKAVCVFLHGHRACANQAVVAIKKGDIVAQAVTKDRINIDVYLYEVADIDIENKVCTLKPAEYKDKYALVILRAAEKCCIYHCREPIFVYTGNEGISDKY